MLVRLPDIFSFDAWVDYAIVWLKHTDSRSNVSRAEREHERTGAVVVDWAGMNWQNPLLFFGREWDVADALYSPAPLVAMPANLRDAWRDVCVAGLYPCHDRFPAAASPSGLLRGKKARLNKSARPLLLTSFHVIVVYYINDNLIDLVAVMTALKARSLIQNGPGEHRHFDWFWTACARAKQ